MSAEVVEDHAHVELFRDLLVYLAEEDEELLITVPPVELRDDGAVEYVQRDEEVDGLVVHVFVRHARRRARTELEPSLAPVKSLGARLLVHADYQDPVWRVHVEADNVPRPLVAQLEGTLPVRPNLMRLLNLLHRIVANAHLPRQGASAPLGRATGLGVKRPVHDFVDFLLGDLRLPPRPWSAPPYLVDARREEAVLPERNRVLTCVLPSALRLFSQPRAATKTKFERRTRLCGVERSFYHLESWSSSSSVGLTEGATSTRNGMRQVSI